MHFDQHVKTKEMEQCQEFCSSFCDKRFMGSLLVNMATQSWEVQKCHRITDVKHSLKLSLLFCRIFKVVLHFFPLYYDLQETKDGCLIILNLNFL